MRLKDKTAGVTGADSGFGAGDTPLLPRFPGEDTPGMRARFLSTIPMGRFSTPEDLAQAVPCLCSDEASRVTGVCMEIDGGRCI